MVIARGEAGRESESEHKTAHRKIHSAPQTTTIAWDQKRKKSTTTGTTSQLDTRIEQKSTGQQRETSRRREQQRDTTIPEKAGDFFNKTYFTAKFSSEHFRPFIFKP